MSAWVEERAQEFRSLREAAIRRWRAVEMALREEGRGGVPQFNDPAIPFLQLQILHLELGDDRTLAVATYQDGPWWGLWSWPAEAALQDGEDGIFRTGDLPDLPLGQLTEVDVRLSDGGIISEVSFSFSDQEIILVAGEVHEDRDGNLRFVKDDESVLLFTRKEDLEAVEWCSQRAGDEGA